MSNIYLDNADTELEEAEREIRRIREKLETSMIDADGAKVLHVTMARLSEAYASITSHIDVAHDLAVERQRYTPAVCSGYECATGRTCPACDVDAIADQSADTPEGS